jgi:transposase
MSTIEGAVDSDVVIHFFNAFCRTLQGPTVVVVDNASIHTSEAFQEALPQWEKQGLWIFYLPEYSPELNLIEILWRFMKYEWIEFWAYTSWNHLVTYVVGRLKTPYLDQILCPVFGPGHFAPKCPYLLGFGLQ